MTPVVASLPVRELVLGPWRDVRVLAVFPHAAYIEMVADDPGDAPSPLVTLVTVDGVAHPNALVVPDRHTDRPFARLHRGQAGRIGEGALALEAAVYRPTRWRSAVPSLPATDPDRLASASAALRAHLQQRTGPLPTDLTVPAVTVAGGLVDGDVEVVRATAAGLVGRGPGLTPAGDDVLAGVLAALRTLASAVGGDRRLTATLDAVGPRLVAHARGRTTDVSLALLDHATRGEVAAPAGTLLHALAAHAPRTTDLAAATDRLLTVGSTSGRDLAIGLLAAAEQLVHRGAGSTERPPEAASTPARARPHGAPKLVPG